MPQTKIEPEAAVASVPTGAILAWTTTTAPTGYLKCDGSAVSQSTYADLYAVIGTDYGDPGGGNFNLPDLDTKVIYGAEASLGDAVTGAGMAGSHNHTVTAKSSGDPRLQTTSDDGSTQWGTSAAGSLSGFKLQYIIKT